MNLWLQAGQARLGAMVSRFRDLAPEPRAPVGQANRGLSRLGKATSQSRPPMGLSHRSQWSAARTSLPSLHLTDPDGLDPSGESGSQASHAPMRLVGFARNRKLRWTS